MLNLNFCDAAEETGFVSSLPTCAAKWLFIASALIFLAPIAVWVLRRFALWVMCKKTKVGTNRTRLGWLTALAFVGTICLKIIVSLNLENNASLNGFGHFTTVMLTSFMALGGDENAVEHLTVLARVAGECFGEGSCLTEFFVGYSAVLDVLAPILGCAFLFDLLLKYFPKLRLWTAVLNRHYYFSELNERSLALAESIVKKSEGWLFRPLLIFTDTYVDDESEISSELYLQARDLGAVCISDDITHVSSLSFKSKTFFLIDENEPKNLHTLAAISEGDKCLKLKNSKVYIFYQNNAYLSMENRILNEIKRRYVRKYYKKIEKYVIKTEPKKINCFKALFKEELMQGFSEALKQWCYYYVANELYYENLADKRKKVQDKIANTVSDALNGRTKEDEPKVNGAKQFIEKKLSEEELKAKTAKLKIKLCNKIKEEKEAQLIPEIERIRYYQNLIFRLLKDYPLYKHLIGRSRNGEEDFNLTILGNGEIGMQMLQSAMWCGQFYGYKLNINVVSKETKEEFCQKLNLISPEILASATPYDKVLEVYLDSNRGEYNPTYFTLRYLQANVDECEIDKLVCEGVCEENKDFNIIDSDYFLVALGSDESNLTVSERLRTALDSRHVNKCYSERRECKTIVGHKKVIVATAIFDDSICELYKKPLLDRTDRDYDAVYQMFRDKSKPEPEQFDYPSDINSCVEMVAFGSLSESYGWDNITLDELGAGINRSEEYYNSLNNSKHKKYSRITTMYDHWSNAAKATHAKYKIFSAYNYCMDNNIECEWLQGKTFCLDKADTEIYDRIIKENKVLNYNLAWYEHRRWTAYIRSIGFSRMELEYNPVEKISQGANKILSLKLHIALVESEYENTTEDDKLDLLLKAWDPDYKNYDRPQPYNEEE